MKVIRDAVHGDIALDALAVSILDTPEMQRLRGIKQLGTASLVYPSAVHTRFEHALGTYHVARRILGALEARGGGRLPGRLAEAAAVAALVHDVTHVPFGHTFEDERRLFERHDAPGRTLRFLRAGALGRAIDRSGLRDGVEAILAGEPDPPLAADVVRGTVGADLLDYLARDAYFCGFRRTYDERVFRYFEAAGGRLALAVTAGGAVRSDALSEVANLLQLRYTLCERVYYHHAKVAAGAAVSKAVELGIELGLALEDLFPLRDEGLFALLRERYAPRSAALAAVLDRVEGRRLYKRAFVLGPGIGAAAQEALVARFHFDRASRRAAEDEIAGAAGIGPEDVIVYCPAPGMAAKEADIPVVVDPAGPPRPLADLRLPEVDVLVAKHRGLWRFYVLVAGEKREAAGAAVARAAERMSGHRNELGVAA